MTHLLQFVQDNSGRIRSLLKVGAAVTAVCFLAAVSAYAAPINTTVNVISPSSGVACLPGSTGTLDITAAGALTFSNAGGCLLSGFYDSEGGAGGPLSGLITLTPGIYYESSGSACASTGVCNPAGLQTLGVQITPTTILITDSNAIGVFDHSNIVSGGSIFVTVGNPTVPEPATICLMLVPLVLIPVARRKFRA